MPSASRRSGPGGGGSAHRRRLRRCLERRFKIGAEERLITSFTFEAGLEICLRHGLAAPHNRKFFPCSLQQGVMPCGTISLERPGHWMIRHPRKHRLRHKSVLQASAPKKTNKKVSSSRPPQKAVEVAPRPKTRGDDCSYTAFRNRTEY